MPEPFIGEIRVFAFGKIPQGWMPCNGSVLPIQQFQVLYAILGTAYGGDGLHTFCVPHLMGRTPVHPGPTIGIGQAGGWETHKLQVNEMPVHTHRAGAGSDVAAGATSPKGKTWGTSFVNAYAHEHDGPMKADAIGEAGSNMPHNNMQPSIVFQYCIAYEGIFPPSP